MQQQVASGLFADSHASRAARSLLFLPDLIYGIGAFLRTLLNPVR